MTTLNGFIRSTNATINRLERAAERHAREAAKQEKLRLKAEQHALAEQAFQAYQELMTSLVSLHKALVEPVDWQDVFQQPQPAAPTPNRKREFEASEKLTAYRPSFFDKLFKTAGTKRAKLDKAVAKARSLDDQAYQNNLEEYEHECARWLTLHTLASGVLRKNPDAYHRAIQHFDPFPNATLGPNPPSFQFDPRYIQVDWTAEPPSVIPNYALSLTATGKLSKKDLAASRHHELYRDHICSTLLSIGSEVLALLPVDLTLVNIHTELVDPATGQLEKRPIVSVVLYPETLARLNFEQLDPAEALKNFKHNMQFTKTGGFKPIDPIELHLVLTS